MNPEPGEGRVMDLEQQRRRVSVDLLGGFQLRCGDGPVELPEAAQRVVAFVALRERPVHRRLVAVELWPDVDERRALANLRSTLWRVRQTSVPVINGASAALKLCDGVTVDTARMSAAAHRLFGGEVSSMNGAEFEQELLPDWYEDWVLLERERLRQLALHALDALVGQLVAERRFGEAIDTGLRAVRLEPLRETARHALIDAYLAEGNHVEAVRQYRSYADLLRREMNIAPSHDLESLLHTRS